MTAPTVRERWADPVARIETARQRPDAARWLLELLPEGSPLYARRGTNEAERLRGYLLASFENVGLPPEAVPFVLEELEIGRHPYAVAGAARALRGAYTMPPEAPSLLVGAITRLRGNDDVVSFDDFAPEAAIEGSVTALCELAMTLSLLGPQAKAALPTLKSLVADDDRRFSPSVRAALGEALESLARPETAPCCCGPAPVAGLSPSAVQVRRRAPRPQLSTLMLENQDGERLAFAEAFSSRPTALAFFYTRCTNPDKCSLTVTRLARVAQRVAADELDANVAGISYDPGWDNPGRLRRYGSDRGMRFSSRCTLLRTVDAIDPLIEAFELGVGFGPVTVNRHRLDLIVLDRELGVVQHFERRLWSEETVHDVLRGLATREPAQPSAVA
jgi:protein SCO1/2